MAKNEDIGIIGGVDVGLPILMVMGAFLSIALYNVIELTFLIFATFTRREGLYFWSLVIATWGIALHGVGFTFKFFQVISINVLSCALIGVGWVGMVTGQSVVLYSRLHLVVWDKRKIRWVLFMIIFNVVFVHCPMIVLALCTETIQSPRIVHTFITFDKVQIVIFFIQEAIISIIYIHQTMRLLRQGEESNDRPLRKLLAHLIFVNLVVLILDISVLCTQFAGHYEIQTTYKTAVYSVKLKIEFSILNRLVDIVKNKDISGNRASKGNRQLSLATWIDAKKSQLSNSTGGCSSFIKMDDFSSRSGDGKHSAVKTSVVDIEQVDSVSPRDKRIDLEIGVEHVESLQGSHSESEDQKRATF